MPTTFSPGTLAFMILWLFALAFWACRILLRKKRQQNPRNINGKGVPVPTAVSQEETSLGFSKDETTLLDHSSDVASDDTIVDILKINCQQYYPDQGLLQEWVNTQCQVVDSLTYKSLWRQSGAITSLLVSKGLTKGDRFMITYPPGLPFLAAFVACFRTGIIACTVYPPDPSSKARRAKFAFKQFNSQVTDAGAKYALTTRTFKRMMKIAPMTVGQTT
jgi:hypothetical protein